MIRRLAKWLAPLAAAAVAACTAAGPAKAPATPRPALWTLADSDTRIYLFGTFHLLPESHSWRTPAIDRALAEADELVLEIGDIDDKAAAAGTMMRLGVSPGLPPLTERVPEGKRDELAAMVADSGVPMAVLDRLETWAAALALTAAMAKRLGLSAEAGVERRLTGDLKRSGKPIRGVETIEDQLGFLDGLSEEAQRTFLVALLDDPEAMRRQFAAMLGAWTRGDVDAIAATFNEEANLSPELRDALLKRRNARWADWLARRLERPGTIFFAVGAGHLAGPDSVQAMLAARGLTAKRVQ
jgi:uncharacterized protein YbaP (TraB family)